MKKLYLILSFLFSISFSYGQITYVNSAASGANDGSSWENAFTDIQSALDKFNGTQVFSEEAIWIASGSYKPGGMTPDTSSSFLIDAEVDLYGGFAGTESDISERDIAQNETILSGDFLGNDGSELDSILRVENARHVIFINPTLNDVITIDGFTIEGGNTSLDGDHEFLNRAGGGILSGSPINISNCTFKNNLGRSGASVAIDGRGSVNAALLFEIKDCVFSDNEATEQAAGVVVYEMQNFSVTGCTFENNQTNRGCLYPSRCGSVLVSDCLFESNTNDNFGGGMFSWQTTDLTIDNSIFRSNRSRQAGGMYYDARELVSGNPSFTITNTQFINNETTDGVGGGITVFQGTNVTVDNCRFNGNQSRSGGGLYFNGVDSPKNPDHFMITNTEFSSNEVTERGGGFYSAGGSYTMENCNILGNTSGNTGGGVYNSSNPNKNCNILNCVFGNNLSAWGGAVTSYGDSTIVIIDGGNFLSNEAENGGGAVHCGFNAKVLLMNSDIGNNIASVGGGVALQNDSTTLVMTNCNITSNTASGNGGGLFSYEAHNNITVENSVFSRNSGDFGGAISVSSYDTVEVAIDTSFLLLSNSIFTENTAANQGGAINFLTRDGRIENCVINDNTANGPGTGGAISHNASGITEINLEIVNSTIVNNLGLLSSGIAAFTSGTAQSIITCTNTVFKNLSDYRVEDGTPVFISSGGNFSRDPVMEDYFINEDIIGNDPLFVDELAFDYQLTENSPCRDAGVPGGTDVDITGFERDMNPDIGAYEWRIMSGINDPLYSEKISISPNPTASILNVDFDGTLNDNHQVLIYNSLGENVMSAKMEKGQLDVSHLENGLYHLMLLENNNKHITNFIKIN